MFLKPLCHLVKKEMPKFMKKPENVECTEFDNVSFETTVTGKPEPVVEWWRGDVKLDSSERIELTQVGEVHTVVIKGVLKAEEGIINVKATNEVGQMSSSARLKITGAFTKKKILILLNRHGYIYF